MGGADTGLAARMRAELAAKLTEGAEWAMEGRAARYDARPHEAPSPQSVDAIIKKFVAANVAIVAAANVVPGPFGLLTIVPEIATTLRNQLVMVHDIGYALGKKERLTAPLLLGVLAMGMAGGGLGFIVIKGQKVIVRRATLRVLQKLVERLAGKVTQRVLKQLVLKWAPIVAPAVMATWAGYTTGAIGNKAKEVFSKEIVDEDTGVEDHQAGSKPHRPRGVDGSAGVAPTPDEDEILRRHATCLVNLMNADGVRRRQELEFFAEFIERAELPADIADRLMQRAELGRRLPVGLAPFKQSSEHAEALLIDLVALSLRDGELHDNEVCYVREVAAELGVSDSQIDTMLKLEQEKA